MFDVADVLVVGAGLSGLVAAAEAADAGRSVLIVDQEPEQNIGSQASWSLGGLFFVDSPEQRMTRTNWHGRTGLAQPRSIARKIIGPADGQRPTWRSLPARSAHGSALWAIGFSRSSDGQSEGVTMPPAMATPCPAST